MSGIRRKWRPPLALVIGGTLAAVFCLPLVGLVYFRLWGNVLGWGEAAWLIAWLAAVATGILGFLLWRLVLRPVTALTAHAQAMKAGHSNAGPPTHFGTPEFSELGAAVIAMGETLHNRATSLRAYADHVTHELKSPLTSLRGAAELLQNDLSEDQRAELIATIATSADRMDRLLSDLRRHAAASQSAGVGSAHLSQLEGQIGGVEVEIVQDAAVPVALDDLRVVMDQLAQNAAAHGATKMRLDMVGTTLRISDNGQGIAPGNAARIFDPFFTTRRDTGGTGMGLTIVQSLLAARGARIALDTAQPGPGAAFVIDFD